MAGSGNSFVDEIYDQFLMCRMCSETYKNPKVLSCMHTFCEKCLEAHYEMEDQDRPYRFLLYTRALTCPMCHSRTELPTGGVHRLPDNFLVANLSDVVDRRKPSLKDPACEICKPDAETETTETDKRAAVSKCLDCAKLLCAGCAELHRRTRVTETHALFDFRAEQDVECKLHASEALRFYCDPCEECICVLCTFHDHRDHDVSSLIDALDRHRAPFEALMNRCRGRIDALGDQVALIDRCERGLKAAEDRIRDAAIDAIAAVRKREKDLLLDLRNTLGDQAIEFIGEKKTFKENLKNLEGSFGLTNAMLTGTKIDLLIVKKEMEKKLNAILDVRTTKTPETLLKRKDFQFCDENCYDDVIRSAVDRMARPDGTRAPQEGRDRDPRRPPAETRSIATETTAANDDPLPSKPSRREDEPFWQRPMAVVTATETPRTPGTVVLRPVRGGLRIRDSAAQTTRVVVADGSTDMPVVAHLDKETNTSSVHVMQKAVSTDNQTMVDKSTTTAMVDVSAAYRGAATTAKRPVMVSRGTCTPRTMMMDKETLSLPSGTTSSGGSCSPPVAWLSRPTAADQNTGKSGDGSAEKADVFTSVGHVINENSSPGDKSVSQPTAFNANTVSSSTAIVVSASRTPGPVISGPVKPPEQATPSPSVTTQVKPCQGQGFAAERPQGPLQIGPNQASVSRSQAVPGSQVGHGLVRSSTTVPAPGTQGSQVSTNVPGSQNIPEAQVGQVRHQGPAILPGTQSVGIIQGTPALNNKGPTTLPGPQTISGIRIPGSAVSPGPQIIPGVPSLPGVQRGPVSVIVPRPPSTFVPTSPPGSQTARLQGPANVLRYEATPGAHQTGQAPGVGSSTPGAQGGSQTTMPGSQFVPVTQSSQPISHYPTSMARTPTTYGGPQSVMNAVASSPITGTNNQISTQVNETNAAAKHVQNPTAAAAAATANSGVTNVPAVAPNPAPQTTTAKLSQTPANLSGLRQVVANGPQNLNAQCLNVHTNVAISQIVTVSNPALGKSAALPAMGQNSATPANGVITVNRNATIPGQTPPSPGAGQRDASRPSVCPLGPTPGSLSSAPIGSSSAAMTLSSAPGQAVGGFLGSRPAPKISPSNVSINQITSQNSVPPATSKVNASSINGQNPSPGGVPAAPSNVPFHASNRSPNIPNNNNNSSSIVSNCSANNVPTQRFGGPPTGDKVTPHGPWRGVPSTAGEVPVQQSPALAPTAVGRELGLPQPLHGNMTTRGCQLYASINANPSTVGGVKSSFPGGSLPGSSSFHGNATSTSLAGSKADTQNPVPTSATNAKHP